MIKTKTFYITLLGIMCCFILFNTVPNVVSGETQDGEVQLNDGLVNREIMFESSQNLAPSQIVSSKDIQIKNTGKLSLEMYEKFFFTLKQDGFTSEQLSNMLEKYFVKAHLYINGKKVNVEGLTTNWINAREFNTVFNDEQGKGIGVLRPEDLLSIKLEVKLDESAGNEYQGALLNVDFLATGIMSVSEDGLLLPNTATNNNNYFIIGLLLVTLGTLLYLAKRPSFGDVRK